MGHHPGRPPAPGHIHNFFYPQSSTPPPGDHFSVETRWDITPDGPDACRMRVRCRIPFSKTTLWKQFIEKGVLESVGEAVGVFRQLVSTLIIIY